MANKLDDTPVKMGNVIKVENTDRKCGAASAYYAVKLENFQGKKEFWCLWTDQDLGVLVDVHGLKDAKSFKPGRIYHKHTVGKSTRGFVALNFPAEDGKLKRRVVSITKTVLDKGLKRAKANQEDIPKMGWLADLLD